MRNQSLATAVACIALLAANPVLAASDSDIQALKQEIQSIKKAYESRISDLESKLQNLADEKTAARQSMAPAPTSVAGRNSSFNSFNPAINVILNGKYASFSEKNSEIAGFGIGEEGERGRQGLSIDESELNFAANIDDKFYGSLTAAIVREGGEDKIELEEAYAKTLPGMGLPDGLNLKVGRAFWTLGYLNEHHTHTDDFADRPLPYRAFLNNGFNDDGVELSYVLPTDIYTEIGGGVFRGDDFPFGASDGEAISAWSAFARVGGDIGDNQTWRVGGYVLSGEAKGGRASNEDTVTFIGNTDLYATDLRYTWAPTGNAHEKEVTLQAEYFWRKEDGTYEDTNAGTGPIGFDGHANGWYVQGVYKFLPQWRIGTRYSRLESPNVPAGLVGSVLDSGGTNPEVYSVMADWTNSEFSRVRLQYNREELSAGQNDDQFLLQYVMSLGAHGAHNY